jgi:predicted HAD superfamily Cof-like phosphohydrolase
MKNTQESLQEKATTLSIVDKIKDWSEVFGAPILDFPGFPEIDRMRLAMDLIDEEFYETIHAIDAKNFSEVRDGLGDMLWVVIRAMMEFGIDPEETMKEIYYSNMSKADYTNEDALKTRDKYRSEGIDTYMRIRSGAYITYNAETGKILKSCNFKAPNF